MATDWIRPGELLAGRYRIETVLGEGGMGVVVAATHMQLGKRVAVKILRPQLASDEEQSARFSREAHAGVRLTGEHSVHVLDVGQLEDGTPYMVMEFLVGADLGEVLTQRRKLTPADAVDYILQATEGIAEAHAHGIIHRDVKPQNLFLTHRADGSPLIKVLDFGLNKDVDNDKSLTKSRTIFGSPYYMSPEQMKASRDVDARTDIWALGACLYELVVGEPPFEAPTVAELTIKVLQETPVLPHLREPAVPEGLSTVILLCLERDPSRRFPDVRALAAALEPFASARARGAAERVASIFRMVQPSAHGRAPSLPRIPGASADPLTRTEASWDSAARRETRVRKGLIAAVTALVVTALGIAGMLMFRTAPSAPATTAPAAAPAPAPAPDPASASASAPAPASASAPASAPPPPVASAPRPRPRPPRNAKPAPTQAATSAPAPPATSDPNDRP
jgi:eukaryotic-like serine/threonine-protein kinase